VESTELTRVTAEYRELRDARITPLSVGLIHRSFAVAGARGEFILQQVNPIFCAGIHENIAAVTEHLHRKGMTTLRLVPTRKGRLWLDLGEQGRWRLLTRIPGATFHTCESPGQARAAGALVARFHSALADLEHDFRALGTPLHDTPRHLENLRQALAAQRSHRLHEPVAEIAARVFEAAEQWTDLGPLPLRVIHGDLKFNNVLFAGEAAAQRQCAVSLIDLDTVSRMPLWVELGDAWRSWCNASGENEVEARLDLEIFQASSAGYLEGLSLELSVEERKSLAHGLERISLELAARFAADALNESYFGWDAKRFAAAGDHNLSRARGQLSLHSQAVATREERLRFLTS
jgi:Ser/Thr protein kinase RdoA (MazF antagonist)